MNRQLIAFLSLFSLVLVLSVYYVLMPGVNTSSGGNIQENAVAVNNLIEDASSYYYETLSLERNKYYEDYITEQEALVASTSTQTNDEIAVHLNNIVNIKKQRKTENSIIECIKALGYKYVYTEIETSKIKNEDKLYVNVITKRISSEDEELLETVNIIDSVQSLLDDNQLLITVTFHD